jgi:hypothetical protein
VIDFIFKKVRKERKKKRERETDRGTFVDFIFNNNFFDFFYFTHFSDFDFFSLLLLSLLVGVATAVFVV